MNYIFYKESDNSIVGMRFHNNALEDYQISSILLGMSEQFGESILCGAVEDSGVVLDDYENRYLGFNPDSNALIINENYTPPEPSIEEEAQSPVTNPEAKTIID